MPPPLAISRREKDTTPLMFHPPYRGQGWSAFPSLVWWCPVIEFEDDRSTPPESDWDVLNPGLVPERGFGETIRQIFDLATGESCDEYGMLRPTEHAQRRTLKVLTRAQKAFADDVFNQRLNRLFPKGFVATDSQGGIRIEWSNNENSVRLVIAATESGQSYIYYEDESEYGTSHRVNGSELARFLRRVS